VDMSEALQSFQDVHDSSEYPLIGHLPQYYFRKPKASVVGNSMHEEPMSEESAFEENAARLTRPTQVMEPHASGHSMRNTNNEDDDDNDDDENLNFEAILKILNENEDNPVSRAIQNIYQNRRIFRTEKRNMVGIGPRDIRKDDFICLVAGVPAPLIFGQMENKANNEHAAHFARHRAERVRLIGSAYVHGRCTESLWMS